MSSIEVSRRSPLSWSTWSRKNWYCCTAMCGYGVRGCKIVVSAPAQPSILQTYLVPIIYFCVCTFAFRPTQVKNQSRRFCSSTLCLGPAVQALSVENFDTRNGHSEKINLKNVKYKDSPQLRYMNKNLCKYLFIYYRPYLRRFLLVGKLMWIYIVYIS